MYLSPRFSQLLGFAANEELPASEALLQHVHEEDRAAVRDVFEEMARRDTAIDLEFRVARRSGGFRWVQIRDNSFSDSGQPVAYPADSLNDIGGCRDVDEQRREYLLDERNRKEQAQIALREQVHGHVARELHDDLGQRLTGVAFLMKALEERLSAHSPADCEHASSIVKMTNEVIERMRFLSHQLGSIADEISLDAALNKLVEDTRNIFGTTITIAINGRKHDLPHTHAAHLLRIAQESVNNALRHGGATAIALRLDVDDKCTRLAVVDNGAGFEPGSVDKSASLGLRSMAIRARAMQGYLRIRSNSRGTLVLVRARGNSRLSGESAA